MRMADQQQNSTGSLVLIHHHNNFELLQLLTDTNDKLYYKDKPVSPINDPDLLNLFTEINNKLCFRGNPVFPINDPDLLNLLTDKNGVLQYNKKPIMAPLKNSPVNALNLTSDGELFVDGTYFLTQTQYNVLSKFNYTSPKLTFNGKEIQLELNNADIEIMIDGVWANIEGNSKYSWIKNS